MKPRFYIFITLSALCFLAAFLLALQQMTRYQTLDKIFPAGSTIAGLPVGGLDSETAGARVVQAYLLTPIELHYDGAVIQIDPQAAGLTIDLSKMLDIAQERMRSENFWKGYWSFLWNHLPGAVQVAVECSVNDALLRDSLSSIFASGYGQSPTPAQPVPGGLNFIPGKPGRAPDGQKALEQIRSSLCSLTSRTIEIESVLVPSLPPMADSLDPALEALIQTSGFDGLVELYYQDLNSGQQIQMAYNNGRRVEPGVAFTAASTIKIPVMVSTFRKIDGDLPDSLRQKMAEMIALSDNASTDTVMQMALDPNLAPVEVTRDIRTLGLENTFLAGFFFTGAPLLDRYTTPANQRGDLSTDPDIYNQTTAADMGHLLAAIYQCSTNGTGPLIQAFSGQVSQAECQQMVEFLAQNRKGVLIEAGLPEGARIAHKYGWVTDSVDNIMHTASDAAIVYTPGGDFVLTVYLYHPTQLHWDPAQALAARLATLIHNFYNETR